MCEKQDVLKMRDVLEIINMARNYLTRKEKLTSTIDQEKDTD